MQRRGRCWGGEAANNTWSYTRVWSEIGGQRWFCQRSESLAWLATGQSIDWECERTILDIYGRLLLMHSWCCGKRPDRLRLFTELSFSGCVSARLNVYYTYVSTGERERRGDLFTYGRGPGQGLCSVSLWVYVSLGNLICRRLRLYG